MSGANVTIADLATQTTMASGDSIPVWSATGDSTYQAFATQIQRMVCGFPFALTGQTTATSTATGAVSFFASSPAGFVSISINGTAVKLPYYNP